MITEDEASSYKMKIKVYPMGSQGELQDQLLEGKHLAAQQNGVEFQSNKFPSTPPRVRLWFIHTRLSVTYLSRSVHFETGPEILL